MATETFIIDIRTRGTKKSASDVRRIGTSATQVRKTLAFLRNALVAVAAIRVFASLTSSLIDFSDQMLVVKAVTGATTQQFQAMRDVAKGLGATTRFTAGEAAEGMAFLARAGFDVNEVMGAIPGVLDLAAAAQLDLGNAADIASNLMTSFGLAVSDIPEIMDTLVFTANNANTTVQQLADGLKLFAPIASQLGISLKDAASFMAVLGNAGIQASLAGTGLRRVITDLEAPTGTLAKVLKALGIDADEVRPSVVGLEKSLKRLAKEGIGASVASALFGKRGGFIAAQLIATIKQSGDFRKELENIEGVSRRAAEEIEKGLGGALRLVRSALQNLIISFGDLGGEDFLNQFFRGVAETLRTIAANANIVTKALKLMLAALVISRITAFTGAIFRATAGLRTFIGFLRVAPGATIRAVFGFRALRASMLAIPFVAIATVLTGLISTFFIFGEQIKLLSNDGGTMADVFDTLGDSLGGAVTDAVNSLGFDFSDFGEIVSTIASRSASAIEGIIAVFFGLVAIVKNAFGKIKLFFKFLVLSFDTVVNGLKQAINAAASAIGRDPVFEGLAGETEALRLETKALGEEIFKTKSLFDAFIEGGRDFLIDRINTTRSRIAAERDAAILATEKANRAAAKARADAAKRKEGANAGISLGDILGDQSGDTERATKDIESLTGALRDLEASFFPLLAASRTREKVTKTINDADAKGIELLVDKDELIKRVIRSDLGLGDTIEQVTAKQDRFNIAMKQSHINLEEMERLSRKVKLDFLDNRIDALSGFERGLLRVNEQFTDVASVAENAVTNAFKGAEDALVDFVATGKLSFNDLIDSIQRDLSRLAIRQAITAPLAGLFGVGNGGAGGGAGGLADLLSPSSQGGQGIGSLFSGLFGAKDGADFTVGGSGGVDSQVVAFRATPGESVTVQTPQQQSQGGGPNITMNFNFPPGTDTDSFRRNESQIAASLSSVVNRAAKRNN